MRPGLACFVFGIGSLLATTGAYACSFAGGVFRPTLEDWEQHEGPKQSDPKADGDYWEGVPAPVVEVVRVGRGSMAAGADCGDAGTIELRLSLPASSTYDIGEFGIYFRVVSGELPDEIFPHIPLTGMVSGKATDVLLAWLDGAPSGQIPLDLEVDVFLVANDLSIGPPTRISVKAPVGGK